MKICMLFLICIYALFTSVTLKAETYYVSNAGDDDHDGLNSNGAFLTIQHAADIVEAGDTVYVANGEYAGFDLRDINGTSDNPIVFIANGNSVLINESGPKRDDGINIESANCIVIDGFICNDMIGDGNGIRVVTSDFCVIKNCRCDNNAERGIFTGFTNDIIIEYNVCSNSVDEHGIYVSNSSDRPIVRYNECYGNNGCGIHMNGDASMGDDGIISDAHIYGNIIHDNNKASSINLDGVLNPIIYNNLIYNNHDCQGIVMFQIDGAVVSHGAKIYNNTIIVPDDGRWGILLQDGANVNTEIYNNIIINLHSWRGCLGVNDTTDLKSDYNIVNDRMGIEGDESTISLEKWQNLGFDQNSLIANDLSEIFENPGSNNYHLKTGSQGINHGTDMVEAIVTYDMDGFMRPEGTAYDIGAFEYGSETAINEPFINKLEISPNPASEYLNIRYSDPSATIVSIELIGINGSLINTFSPDEQIDISQYAYGLFLIRVQLSNQKSVTSKLVIN